MEFTMRNPSVSRGMVAVALAAGALMSAGTALARDYDMKSLHPGGLDPNTYITSVAVGSKTTVVSWSALQGPFQIEACTNLVNTNWFPVSPITNVLSGSCPVANPSTNGLTLYRVSSPAAQYLIARAGRMSQRIDAELFVIYVDIGSDDNPQDQRSLAQNVQFAENMGAQVLRTKGKNVAEEVAKDAYTAEGMPERFIPDDIRFLSDRQFAWASPISCWNRPAPTRDRCITASPPSAKPMRKPVGE